MATDPYQAGMFKKDPYFKKKDCAGELCVVLDGSFESRALQLMVPPSRAFLAGDIHELIVTDEQEAGPGREVNRIAYWGFFEVSDASVVVAGDEITVGGKCAGRIAGFDETHMPNHLNVVIRAAERVSGAELGLALGDKVRIVKKA
ncbi:MAG: hypothetical protein LBK98_05295 [Peptococcaceae bacterium]|jgi:hypothetical protein|nr:hypothetical protein [Peptococcaceae bacterium]